MTASSSSSTDTINPLPVTRRRGSSSKLSTVMNRMNLDATPQATTSSADHFYTALETVDVVRTPSSAQNTTELLITDSAVSTFLKGYKFVQINGKMYMLMSIIGRGASSRVFEAIGPDRKGCAVKWVDLEGVDSTGYKNEVEVLRRLQHCNDIIRMIDCFIDETKLLLVLERGDTDLATFFRSSRVDKSDVPSFVRLYWSQMVRAVKSLHENEIVHTDLKPANFVLVAGSVKLIDFGIAVAFQQGKTAITRNRIMGTFDFISPEAINWTGDNKYQISRKSDVWSLGCILYQMVFGQTPFQSIPNEYLKLHAICNAEHDISYPATDIPHVVNIIQHCLNRDPADRPSVDELMQYLTSC